jgi:hypothetical protein
MSASPRSIGRCYEQWRGKLTCKTTVTVAQPYEQPQPQVRVALPALPTSRIR